MSTAEPSRSQPERVDPEYARTLAQMKDAVRSARISAARRVNTEMIVLYWRLGRLIDEQMHQLGWGARVVDRLSADLRGEFPDARGFSPRNLRYMRRLAQVWPDEEMLLHVVATLGWGHIQTLLDQVDDGKVRDWYAQAAASYGWSRNTLVTHIATNLHARTGAAPNNFAAALPDERSELVADIVKDPVRLDFLTLDPGFSERHLEDALVAHLTHLIAELGHGFSFVGRQVPLTVGDTELFIDLLFYHLGLRRFVVFELKIGKVAPGDVGQLATYVGIADDLLRKREHGDGPTIGILLAAGRDDVVVQYALRGTSVPVAVATFTTDAELPDELRPALPSSEDLLGVVRTARADGHDLDGEV